MLYVNRTKNVNLKCADFAIIHFADKILFGRVCVHIEMNSFNLVSLIR